MGEVLEVDISMQNDHQQRPGMRLEDQVLRRRLAAIRDMCLFAQMAPFDTDATAMHMRLIVRGGGPGISWQAQLDLLVRCTLRG